MLIAARAVAPRRILKDGAEVQTMLTVVAWTG